MVYKGKKEIHHNHETKIYIHVDCVRQKYTIEVETENRSTVSTVERVESLFLYIPKTLLRHSAVICFLYFSQQPTSPEKERERESARENGERKRESEREREKERCIVLRVADSSAGFIPSSQRVVSLAGRQESGQERPGWQTDQATTLAQSSLTARETSIHASSSS